MSQPSAEELRQRSQDLLAHIERTEDSLTRQLRKAEPPPAPSAAPTSAMQDLLPAATPEPGASTNFFELSAQEAQQYFRPATELEAGATPAPTQASSETQAASAQMLLRAAEQQRRLAALLPDEKARAEMVQLAEQQESQARTLLASTHAAAASAASTATPATGAAPHPSEDAPPAREDMAAFTPAPLPRVTATLRRDSAQLFKLLLKECPSGVLISKLLPSDSGDERGQLREGDLVRTINGLSPTEMGIEQLKAYVRDCPGALYLEVERFASPSATALPHPAARHAHAAGGSGGSGGGGGMHGGGGMGGGGMGGGNDGGGNEGLDNVLGSVKNGWEQLGRQLHNFMERPDVTELRDKAGETSQRLGGQLNEFGQKAGEGFKNWFDETRGQVEERGRDLRKMGTELRHKLDEPPGHHPGHHPGQHPDGRPDGHPGSRAPSSIASSIAPHARADPPLVPPTVGPGAPYHGASAAPYSAGWGAAPPAAAGWEGAWGAAVPNGAAWDGAAVQNGVPPPTADDVMDEATQLAIALSLSERQSPAAHADAPLIAFEAPQPPHAAPPLATPGAVDSLVDLSEAPADAAAPPTAPGSAPAAAGALGLSESPRAGALGLSESPRAGALGLSESEELELALSLSLEAAQEAERRHAAEQRLLAEAFGTAAPAAAAFDTAAPAAAAIGTAAPSVAAGAPPAPTAQPALGGGLEELLSASPPAPVPHAPVQSDPLVGSLLDVMALAAPATAGAPRPQAASGVAAAPSGALGGLIDMEL